MVDLDTITNHQDPITNTAKERNERLIFFLEGAFW